MPTDPKAAVEAVREALRAIERHHLALNRDAGRDPAKSNTLRLARRGLVALSDLERRESVGTIRVRDRLAMPQMKCGSWVPYIEPDPYEMCPLEPGVTYEIVPVREDATPDPTVAPPGRPIDPHARG